MLASLWCINKKNDRVELGRYKCFVKKRRALDYGPILPYYYPLLYVPHTANNTLHDGILG